MAKRKRRSGGKRRLPGGLSKYAAALKLTKGRGPGCNRKAVLRAVKAGASPQAAVSRYCP